MSPGKQGSNHWRQIVVHPKKCATSHTDVRRARSYSAGLLVKSCAAYHPHKNYTHGISGFPNRVMVMAKRRVVGQLIIVK